MDFGLIRVRDFGFKFQGIGLGFGQIGVWVLLRNGDWFGGFDSGNKR